MNQSTVEISGNNLSSFTGASFVSVLVIINDNHLSIISISFCYHDR